MQILISGNIYSDKNQKFIIVENADYSEGFQERYFPNAKENDFSQGFTVHGEIDGIKYNEELVSCEGLGVMLFIPKDKNKEEIEKVKNDIRYKSDVVRFLYRYEGSENEL